MKNLFYSIFLLFAFSLGSCKKDQASNIPNVYVNVRINLDDPTYTPLNSAGGSVEVAGGINGIIVYRISTVQAPYFAAYEKTCPYSSHNGCTGIVALDGNVSSASDSCCASRFELQSGTPIEGPANQPLRSYKTTYTNNGKDLFITN